MNKPVVLTVSLGVLLVFFVVSCGRLKGQAGMVLVATTEVVTPNATSTNMPTVFPPTATVTPSPTVTETPAPTSTKTAVPTPTQISLQKALDGYTFYGTQLKFLEENFGWSYDLIGCPSNYFKVTNVLDRTPGICAGRVHVTEGDRKYNLYLLEANFFKWVEGVNGGVPYGFMFYLYKGAALPSDIDWLNTPISRVWELVYGRYVRENAVKHSENKCGFKEIPGPQVVYPLTPEEYEALSALPNLFPSWIETCSILGD